MVKERHASSVATVVMHRYLATKRSPYMSTVCDTYAETPTPRGNNMQEESGEKPLKKARLFEVEDEGGEKDVLRPKDLTPAFSGELGNNTLRDTLRLPVAGTTGTLPDETQRYEGSEPATVPGTPTEAMTPRTLPEVFKLQAAETQETVACTADLTVTRTPDLTLPKESKDLSLIHI